MSISTGIRILGAYVALTACHSMRPDEGARHPDAGELTVWTTRALATVLAEVGPEYERLTGQRLRVVSDLPAGFERRAAARAPFDLLISGSATVDEWIRAGRLLGASCTDLARSGIGVAVRAGAPKPELGSVEALRDALLQAKSIAYLRAGSGLYLDTLVQQLGLEDQLRPKTRRPTGDSVATLVADGEVELGLVVLTQILTTPGVELAGPLPREVQSHITFSAGISTNSHAPGPARKLIEFLQGSEARRVIRAQGMSHPPF
jgi:molybdate transport system substrate-binding protein